MMNWIQPMLLHNLPIPLVPRQSLLKILDNFALEQWQVSDKLTLAIPIEEILAYYESKLLRDVIVA